MNKQLTTYQCLSCKMIFEAQRGPTVCINCKHEYIKDLEYEKSKEKKK